MTKHHLGERPAEMKWLKSNRTHLAGLPDLHHFQPRHAGVYDLSAANRPFPSSKNSPFQNETNCKTFLVKMSSICMRITNHFHISSFAHSLSLWRKHRLRALTDYFRLRVVPHFSSGIVEWAKREREWKSPHACRLFSRGVIFTSARVSLALLSQRKNGGYS